MRELIGWIGSAMLAICAIPQAYKAWRDKHSDGVSWGFILLWGGGEIFTLIYIIPMQRLPLLVNYTMNIIFISIIFYYKWRRRW